MKAVVIPHAGAPWCIKELPYLQPKSGQVCIKVHACGLCGTDIHILHGRMPTPYPCGLGHETVGEITEIGPGVTHLRVGDRVGVSWVQRGCGRCRFCQSLSPQYCQHCQTWKEIGGGLSEYTLAWADGCTLLPDDLPYDKAAPLFCAGFTVASGLHNSGARPGQTVGVLGIGGLGHLAIQYAKAKGHRVIAITTDPKKQLLARSIGADEAILAPEELPDLEGIDVFLHTSSDNRLIPQLLPSMNPEGKIVLMGIGPTPLTFSSFDLIPKQLSLIGSTQHHRSSLVDIIELTAKGKVIPMVETFAFENLSHALERLEKGLVRFRAVITME